MRAILLLVGLVSLSVAQNPPAPEALLDSGRRAVNAGLAVADLRSISLQGHQRVMIGSTGRLSEPRRLDIRALFPGRCLRVTNDGTVERRFGFFDNELLNSVRALKPGDQFGATWGREQIDIERVWFARFFLGMLAHTTAVTGLEPRRAAGVSSLQVDGPAGFSAVIDFDETTKMPVRVRHMADVRFPVPGSTMPPPPEKAEIVWTFEQRVPIGGLRLPRRVVRQARDITLEEMQFEKIEINARLGAADFGK